MSGTFAQSAKFSLSQFDMEVQSALLSMDKDEFERHSKMARRSFKTLKEDLEVFRERSLETVDTDDVLKNLTEVENKSNELLSTWNPGKSPKLIQLWRADKKLKRSYRELTTNYDDAAVVGYKFRLDSEQRIVTSTRWNIISLLISAVGSLALSIWLSFLIITPLNRIKITCQDVAKGNFAVRAHGENKDEFGLLADSFNLMLDNIEEKRDNMSSLLTTIPFALFYFDRAGKISQERSLATEKLFPGIDQVSQLQEFFNHFGDSSGQVKDVIDVMFSHAIPFSSAAFLLPQSLKVQAEDGEHLIQLSYRPKKNAKKKLERVIILGEDVTEKLKAQARSRELMERVNRISKISSDLNGYREFLEEVNRLLGSCLGSIDQVSAALMRDLHSLKGLLGIYSFTTIANKVHELESSLALTAPSPRSLMEDIRKIFNEQSDDVAKILALDIGEHFRYYDERKVDTLRRIASASGNAELMDAVSRLERYPVNKVFSKYVLYVQELSRKFEDKKISLTISPGDELTYAEIRPLDPVLIHIFNNSVDHGIEAASDRLLAGKDETGMIRLSCRVSEGKNLEVTITDDGRGIDGEKLLEKARSSGVIKPGTQLSTEEKVSLIFHPGLSTKEKATETSGRGVGMDAVKSHIESQGGTIGVSSSPGAGTVFTIRIPLESHANLLS